MRRQAVLIALVLALSVFGGSAVEGSPITYYFGGTVGPAFGSQDALTGTPFFGQLLYDPDWSTTNGFGFSIPAGTISLTTAWGKSVSTAGSVRLGTWSISESMVLFFEPVLFDESSAFASASFMLRGPWGSFPLYGPAAPPPLPSDLSTYFWFRSLYLSSGDTPGLMESESTVDCFSSDVGGCGASPIPEPASLLLLGTGLVGLRAWRKRRA